MMKRPKRKLKLTNLKLTNAELRYFKRKAKVTTYGNVSELIKRAVKRISIKELKKAS